MPFYQFNSFTGRLKNSANLQPLYPISPNPLQSADPPKIMWDTIKTKIAKVDAPVRGAASAAGGTGKPSTLPPELIAKMKHFQQPGWRSMPVYLMGGTPDKILFGITLAVMVVGLTESAMFYASQANKK